MSSPIIDGLEDRSLQSVTGFGDAWDASLFEGAAYVATTDDAGEPSPTRSLAEAFADELTSLYAAMEEVYDSSFVEPEPSDRGDFGVSLVGQFAAAGDTLSHYQDVVTDESYLSTASAQPTVSVFCWRCLK